MRRMENIFKALFMSASLGLSLFGCFQPDLQTGRFKCDLPGDTCPEGMACISGLCQSRVDDPSSPPAVDMALPSPPPTTKGCTGTGALLASAGGKDAYACSGSFPNPSSSAMSLCAAGYHVCKNTDRALFLDARASGRCDGLRIDGFFAADVSAGYEPSGFVCEPVVAASTPALVGCGVETGARVVNPPCLDLVVAAPCDGTVNGWSCTGGLGSATHAAGKEGGVMCCQN
jgi:hypothetical protein